MRERDHDEHPLFMCGDRISPGRPWSLDCPARLALGNDKGRGWNRFFLCHWRLLGWRQGPAASLLTRITTSRAGRAAANAKEDKLLYIWAVIQISCLILLWSGNSTSEFTVFSCSTLYLSLSKTHHTGFIVLHISPIFFFLSLLFSPYYRAGLVNLRER